jgi:hypothetical protein
MWKNEKESCGDAHMLSQQSETTVHQKTETVIKQTGVKGLVN